MKWYWAFRYFVALLFTPRRQRDLTFRAWVDDLRKCR